MARGEVIETTAGEVAAELARRGISSDERVTITIEPTPELVPGRREARANVVAAGLSSASRAVIASLFVTAGLIPRLSGSGFRDALCPH
jgi:hypothetical protein